MSKIALLCIFFVIPFVAACGVRGENKNRAAPEIISAADLIKQADSAYAERGNLDKARESVNLLKRARFTESQNYEAAWKLAQSCCFVGKIHSGRKGERARF